MENEREKCGFKTVKSINQSVPAKNKITNKSHIIFIKLYKTQNRTKIKQQNKQKGGEKVQNLRRSIQVNKKACKQYLKLFFSLFEGPS